MTARRGAVTGAGHATVVARRRDQDAAAARLRAAAEALSVLADRSTDEQVRASMFAVRLLAEEVEPADWAAAGLPAPGGTTRPARAHPLPLGIAAAMHLARAAMQLRCAAVGQAQRPARWARLTELFARRVPAAHPQLWRLREHTLSARTDAGDVTAPVFRGLYAALERHIVADGPDAYATGLARASLAVAYRVRGTGTDLAEATALTDHEVRVRTGRYGASHPVTLVARSLLVRALLVQAEATLDGPERADLARRALAETDAIRSARDQIFGFRSATAITSRRYEGHALLLLGKHERARACLEHALDFEAARNGGREWPGSGPTHLLLARAHEQGGDPRAAIDHARHACDLLVRDAPGGPALRAAQALLARLQNARPPGGPPGWSAHAAPARSGRGGGHHRPGRSFLVQR